MSQKIVIVINGYARAGKDTVCEFIIQHLRANGWRGHSISSIDPVRNMLESLGVPVGLKRPAERDLMAEVKSALERYNWWATRLCAKDVQDWLTMVPEAPALCFAHMREPMAIEKFRHLFGPIVVTKTLFVSSPREERVLSNIADAAVEGMEYDLTVNNDGTLEDLKAQCDALADMLMLTEEVICDDDFIQNDIAFEEHGSTGQGPFDTAATLPEVDTRGAADPSGYTA